ncbi:MAG: cold-shock protein, partial [Planctomycetota bacterium]
MQGRIRRVIRGRGFGFIVADGRQFFFHHSEVRETAFKRLEAGDLVEFGALDGADGRNPRARDVRVIAKRKAAPAAPEPARDAGADGGAEPRGPRVFSGVWPVEGEAPEPFGGEPDPAAGAPGGGSFEEEADADPEPAEDDPEFVDAVERTVSA